MVDLHDSLRPTGTVSPLPVSEIVTRAKRRKRRRQISATGLAVATMGIAGFAISVVPWTPTETATVADGGEAFLTDPPEASTDDSSIREDSAEDSVDQPTTSRPPTSAGDETTPSSVEAEPETSSTVPSDTQSEGTASEDTASAQSRPVTTPGIRTNSTTTSEWEDGYCVQIDVVNDGPDRRTWQVVLDPDGTVNTLWNATVVEASAGTFVFMGIGGYNDTIQPGASTSFGTCIDTNE